MRDDTLHLGLDNPRLVAALAAVVVARLTRSIAWTIAGGMVALWVAQWVLA
jgi:branched-subunit amino acid transport protein